jgi:hypothetical protein
MPEVKVEVSELNLDFVLKKARNPSSGVLMKNRNGYFSTPELTFLFSDFCLWIQKNFELSEEKSKEIILKMMDDKKIIPKSTTIQSTTLFSFANKIQIVIGL